MNTLRLPLILLVDGYFSFQVFGAQVFLETSLALVSCPPAFSWFPGPACMYTHTHTHTQTHFLHGLPHPSLDWSSVLKTKLWNPIASLFP